MPARTPAEINHWAKHPALYSRNVSKLASYLRAQQQAEAEARQAFVANTAELMEGEEGEKGKEK